ncbi:MAG: S49 family peptidase [Pelagibacterales bacterium]|nr:S49 family peptidase [Pelagibacterales bacterium]OUU61792.1 MAG: S49 family peptidase [Alphaproteobacteria bacterium TMED62]
MFISKKSIIGIVKLSGIISTETRLGSRGGLNLNDLSDSLTKAFCFKNIKAIVLLVNSPGGSPVQSALIANRVRDLAKEKEIPVYCFIEDLAASGGYWLSCAADKIYAMESSIIGSIGVITSGFGAVEALKKIGIERRVYSQGKNKGLLDPFLPEKKDDVKQILNIQKDLHAQFINWIKKRRGKRLKAKDEVLFNAGIWSGVKAKDLGLIDGIGDYYNVMKNIFGEDVKFKDFSKKTSWFKQKFFSSKNSLNSDIIIDNLINKIEERIIWSKYGL